jgi:hypothetical protein
MITRFQICWYCHQIINGEVRIHASLKAWRAEKWEVVGVFSMDEEEWKELVELSHEVGIKVTKDHDAKKYTTVST